MNYQIEDAEGIYGDTNNNQPNFQNAQLHTQSPPQINTNTRQNNQKQPPSFTQKINLFLLSKTGTILASAIALCIGFAFKDLIGSAFTNVLQQLIVKIILLIDKNNYFNLESLVSSENNGLNFNKFISSIITFVLIVISVYYVSSYLTILS